MGTFELEQAQFTGRHRRYGQLDRQQPGQLQQRITSRGAHQPDGDPKDAIILRCSIGTGQHQFVESSILGGGLINDAPELVW